MIRFDVTDFVSFSVHGGADSGGVAGGVDSLLSAIERLVTLSPGQMLAELLPGIHALPNWHPLLVHFPIALLSLFFLLDLSGVLLQRGDCRKIADWMLYLGTLFAAMTVALGLQAAATIPHGDDVHEIMERHEHLGIGLLTLALALLVWRWFGKNSLQGPANVLHLLLAGILATLIAFAADLGGLMVYGHGVAVAPVMAVNQDAAAAHDHGGAGHVHTHAAEADGASQAGTMSPDKPVGEPAATAPAPTATEPSVAPRVHVHADGSRHEHKH